MTRFSDSKFPNRKKLDEINKKLSNPNVLGSSILPDGATELDSAKYKASEMIIRFRHKSGMKQKELAERLSIDEARMSEILHYKVENFTLDRLVGYAQILYPNLKLDLIAA